MAFCRSPSLILWLCWCCLLSHGGIAAPPTDVPPNHLYYNTRNTTEGSIFLKNRNDVLDYLSRNTPLTNSSSNITGSYPDIVYGLAECYNNNQFDCGWCITDIVLVRFQQSCPLAIGAKMWYTDTKYHCYVRYENYNILPASPPAPPSNSSFPAAQNRTKGSKSNRRKIFLGILIPLVALLLAALGAYFTLYKRKKQRANSKRREAFEANLRLTRAYCYEELQAATENFAEHNKLGQGGFGTVYKGILPDGREVAVKKLLPASNTCTGNDEFVNEVSIISSIRQRNLVKLEGYCLEGLQRMLVLEFIVNGNLGDALFGRTIELDWPLRYDIILGVARGLAYLHEESHIQIVHRDIKVSNILLDSKLKPKISDFGISKLFDRERNFATSTRIAGTYGYMAPEYAMRGRLTTKADVFSFGVLALEIVSGRKASDSSLPQGQELLVEWAWKLYSDGLLETLIEPRLKLTDAWKAKALEALKTALLCTISDADSRPAMSQVVAMLLDYLDIPAIPREAPTYFGRTTQQRDSSTTTSTATRSTASVDSAGYEPITVIAPR